jgi:hypothetical protein
MLTIISGPYNSGRTALAAFFYRKLTEAGKSVLLVTDDVPGAQRWLPQELRDKVVDDSVGQSKFCDMVAGVASVRRLTEFNAMVLDLEVHTIQLLGALVGGNALVDGEENPVILLRPEGRRPGNYGTGRDAELITRLFLKATAVFTIVRQDRTITLCTDKDRGGPELVNIPRCFEISAGFVIEESA